MCNDYINPLCLQGPCLLWVLRRAAGRGEIYLLKTCHIPGPSLESSVLYFQATVWSHRERTNFSNSRSRKLRIRRMLWGWCSKEPLLLSKSSLLWPMQRGSSFQGIQWWQPKSSSRFYYSLFSLSCFYVVPSCIPMLKHSQGSLWAEPVQVLFLVQLETHFTLSCQSIPSSQLVTLSVPEGY